MLLTPKTTFMKELLIGLLLLASASLYAQGNDQTAKGGMMVGGSASFGYGFDLLESSSGNINFSLQPSVGFFLSDGFALGGSPLFSIYSRIGDTDYSSLSVGLKLTLSLNFSSSQSLCFLLNRDILFSRKYKNRKIAHGYFVRYIYIIIY